MNDGANSRPALPTSEICGSSWLLTTSILSRAASCAKFAEITLKLLFAASACASSRVAGKAGRSRGNSNTPGAWPMVRTYSARLCASVPSAEVRVPTACANEDFGLCNIGSGDFADPKAILRRLELLAQNLNVVAVDFNESLIAHDVEIGLRHRLEHQGLDGERLRPRRFDRVHRLPGLRDRVATAVNRLRDLQIDRVREKRRILAPDGWLGEAHPIAAHLAGKIDRRAPAGERLRNLLVGCAQQGALRQQLRVAVVSFASASVSVCADTGNVTIIVSPANAATLKTPATTRRRRPEGLRDSDLRHFRAIGTAAVIGSSATVGIYAQPRIQKPASERNLEETGSPRQKSPVAR